MSTTIKPAPPAPGSGKPSGFPTQSFFEDPLNIRTILAAVDFSEESFHALEYAIPLAQRFGASVHLAYVFDGEHQFSSVPITPELFDDREIATHLKKEVERRFSFTLRKSHCHVRSGKPFQEVGETARQFHADLIVIGTHGRAGFKHLTLGSTAEKVVRCAPCPVLVVRGGTGGPIKTATEGIVLRKILVPVDFSECATEGAKFASVFATRVGADLLLMHVVPPADYMAAEGYVARWDWSQLLEAARLSAEDKLDELVNFLPLVGIRAETEVTVGAPVEMLAEKTKQPDVDLVITSTHGYTGLRHAFIGSTAEQLVRKASCPVLVVPSHRRE